jgi:hypothetical protein
VLLDHVGVAHRGVVGVTAGAAKRASLTQQVPAAAELHAHVLRTIVVLAEALEIGAIALLPSLKLMLLGDQSLDPGRQALVTHQTLLTVVTAGICGRSRRRRARSLLELLLDLLKSQNREPGTRDSSRIASGSNDGLGAGDERFEERRERHHLGCGVGRTISLEIPARSAPSTIARASSPSSTLAVRRRAPA